MSRGYKVSLLTALYLAQGLPFGFFAHALPVLLREAGLSLKAIGATACSLPWAQVHGRRSSITGAEPAVAPDAADRIGRRRARSRDRLESGFDAFAAAFAFG